MNQAETGQQMFMSTRDFRTEKSQRLLFSNELGNQFINESREEITAMRRSFFSQIDRLTSLLE